MNDIPFDLPRPTDAGPADRLVQRYIAGEATLAERVAMERWITANPSLGATFHAMRADAEAHASQTGTDDDILHGTQVILAALPVGRAGVGRTGQDFLRDGSGGWRRPFGRGTQRGRSGRALQGGMLGLGSQTLRETIPTIHPVPKLETLFYRHRWVGLWSSVVTVLIGAAIFLTQEAPTIHADVIPRVYTTSAHQRANVDLADGSRVMLAPQTTLRVPRLDAQSRTVILDSGEAYFEVMHGSTQPFIVGSGNVTAQVLGTAFLIRHTAGDPYVHVAVTDGKVRVTIPTHRSGITLTRGQMGDVTDSTSQVSTTDDLAPGIQWGPGHIMFRDTPLATVLEVTARWYGFHFRYADQTFGQQSVTLMISTRSSAEALATIEQMLAVNLSVVGDTITLVPKPPQSLYSAPRLQTYDVWTPKSEVGR